MTPTKPENFRRDAIGMRELIGCECCCVFNLPSTDWPFEGYPAWVVVLDVDQGMLKMRTRWSENEKWVSCSIIKTIAKVRCIETENELTKPWWRFWK